MWRKISAVIISIALLSSGWLGLSGIPLLVALVPLLWISSTAEDSRRGWWSTFWWALATFVGWNIATIWWIWFATPVGPIAATIVSSSLSMVAFMTFHTLSKRVSKPLTYTLLISGWIALEYWYTSGSVSWPWLLLGNGFSSDIWAIQWYEYTGLFGGSLWVLLANVLIFEAYISRRRELIRAAAAVALLPILLSLIIYVTYKTPSQGTIEVALIQPNIHFGRAADRPSKSQQRENLMEMVRQAPSSADYIVMPECSLPDFVVEANPASVAAIRNMRAMSRQNHDDAVLVVGASSIKHYPKGIETATSRQADGYSYDLFNSAIYVPPSGEIKIHHKSKLVIGTESVPFAKWLKAIDWLIIDLGGSLGQLGRGQERVNHTSDKATVGTAICYEALYGAYYGEFVSQGAEAMFIISNDCWWDNTPGYRHLFSMSALRAVEHRRAIARSANTGISGFISSRGDRLETLGWDEQGILCREVELNQKLTVYTQAGDYIARISILVAILSLLNYMVYRIRRRQHLV